MSDGAPTQRTRAYRAGAGWTFLTNHARVLTAVARNPDMRLKEIAATCHLTERAVRSILGDLAASGYLVRTRKGRRNHYRINPDAALRHPADRGAVVADLIALPTSRTPAG
ncbi:helix-turn-helix transcriptional regulator [Yinghuangia sp. YIM S09857]|uniref:helix-turn-helix transcriptional regulator n=1 Tax=Yinghuangia sp. YIM S09857 TaxID=3436929 RepID=UPI003F533192